MSGDMIKLYEETQFPNACVIQDIAGSVLYCKSIENQEMEGIKIYKKIDVKLDKNG